MDMPLSTLTCYNLQKADIMFGLLQVVIDDTVAIRKWSIFCKFTTVNRCVFDCLENLGLMYMPELGGILACLIYVMRTTIFRRLPNGPQAQSKYGATE